MVGYGSKVAGKENVVSEVPPRIDEPRKSKKCAGGKSQIDTVGKLFQ